MIDLSGIELVDIDEIMAHEWPQCFKDGVVPADASMHQMCSDAMVGWALCQVGRPMPSPEFFGKVMAEIEARIGVMADPESLLALSQRLLTEVAESKEAGANLDAPQAGQRLTASDTSPARP